MIEIITVLLKGPKKYRFEYFKETVTKSKKTGLSKSKKVPFFAKTRKKQENQEKQVLFLLKKNHVL